MKKNKVKDFDMDAILNYDFRYFVDCEYDTSSHCESSGCRDEGICRCSTIKNIQIRSVDLLGITREVCVLMKVDEKDEFMTYCVNRILTSAKLWKKDIWDVSSERGYYGEEIGNITLENSGSKAFLYDYLPKLYNAQDNRERIHTILTAEYGYVLEHLSGLSQWDIKSVSRSDIMVGNEHYYRKVDSENYSYYKDWKLPVSVVSIVNGDKYRLIDGYHRFSACSSDKVKVIVGVK